MKKNVVAFVLALVGAIFGLIGGILWTACADTCATIVGEAGPYIAGFVILGMGGAVLALVGGIQAFGYRKGGFVLTLSGLILQVGQLILACVFTEGFIFVLNLWTMLSIVLLVVAVIFAHKKKPAD